MFWCMVLFSRNHFHSDILECRQGFAADLLILCTHLKVDHLNSTQLPADGNNMIGVVYVHSCM